MRSIMAIFRKQRYKGKAGKERIEMKRWMGTEFPRRFFLKAVGGLLFLLFFPRLGLAFFLSQFQTRTVEKENFRFDPQTGQVQWPGNKSEPYQLLIDGLVEESARFFYKDLREFSQIRQISDFHCVEGWSVDDVNWGGFRFQEILKRIKPKPGADYVVFHALGETEDKPKGQGHYIESYPFKELIDPQKEFLLALDMDGKPLIHDRGGPLRLVAPYDLGYKSIKYVTRLEFAKEQMAGWWTLANPVYPVNAPVPRNRLRKKP
jgi:hypothetical protein